MVHKQKQLIDENLSQGSWEFAAIHFFALKLK